MPYLLPSSIVAILLGSSPTPSFSFQVVTKEITSEEWFLIETIRNYRKAYPNGAKMLKTEIMELLNELMDLDYKENQEDEQENED